MGRYSKRERRNIWGLAIVSGLIVGIAYLVLQILSINFPEKFETPFGVGLAEGIIAFITTILITVIVTSIINARD